MRIALTLLCSCMVHAQATDDQNLMQYRLGTGASAAEFETAIGQISEVLSKLPTGTTATTAVRSLISRIEASGGADPDVDALFQNVVDLLNDVLTEFTSFITTQDGIRDSHLTDAVNCNTNAVESGRTTTALGTWTNASSAHKLLREDELSKFNQQETSCGVLLSTMTSLSYNSHCNDATQYVAVHVTQDGSITNWNSWFSSVDQTYSTVNSNYVSQQQECASHFGQWDTAHTDSEDVQSTAESARCSYITQTSTECNVLSGCYSQVEAAFNDWKPGAEAQIAENAAVGEVVKYAICLITELQKDPDRFTAGMVLGPCQVAGADQKANLTKTYEDLPAKNACTPKTGADVEFEAGWPAAGSIEDFRKLQDDRVYTCG